MTATQGTQMDTRETLSIIRASICLTLGKLSADIGGDQSEAFETLLHLVEDGHTLDDMTSEELFAVSYAATLRIVSLESTYAGTDDRGTLDWRVDEIGRAVTIATDALNRATALILESVKS